MDDPTAAQQRPRPADEGRVDLRQFCARLPVPALLWMGGRVRHVNRGAQALLGARGGLVDPLVLQSLMAVVAPHEGEDDRGEATVLRPDGTLRRLRLFDVPMHEGGRPARIWLLQDASRERAAWARLQQSHRRLASLSGAGDAEQERRRRQAAVAVHDELLQPLAALQMNLQAALRPGTGSAPALPGLLQSCADIARAAIGAGRDIVRQLGGSMLDELGLAPALESLAGSLAQRHGLRCGFRARVPDEPLQPPPAEAERCLYRVAEEALAAAVPACGPGVVGLRLAGDRHGRLALRLDIRGPGVPGLWPLLVKAVGLQVLKQRIRGLGGRLVLRQPAADHAVVWARLSDGRPQDDATELAGVEPDAALTRFFYRAPVGLVQADIDGTITLMNPLAAAILLSFCPDDRLDNLLRLLTTVAPDVAAGMARLQGPDGVVCDGLRIRRRRGPAVWLTLKKQAGERWMAVLGEVPAAQRAGRDRARPAVATPPADPPPG